MIYFVVRNEIGNISQSVPLQFQATLTRLGSRYKALRLIITLWQQAIWVAVGNLNRVLTDFTDWLTDSDGSSTGRVAR